MSRRPSQRRLARRPAAAPPRRRFVDLASGLARASRARPVRSIALALAIAFDLVALGPSGRSPAGDPAALPAFARGDLQAAVALQEAHSPDLLSIPGVAGTAVAIGANGLPVVKVYLVHGNVAGLPTSLDGHDYATEVTGAFTAFPDRGAASVAGRPPNDDAIDPRRSFPRPVPIGVSTGQVDVTAGTIAARVVSPEGVFALSNNHVYANKNDANLGDRVLQPGRADGGVEPNDAIGVLHDFEPIRFCAPFPSCPANVIDAAIARTTTEQLGAGTPADGYGIPRAETTRPRLGMEVQKYGRTTGPTTGRITGINAVLNVGFREGTARFTGQVVIARSGFSGPGDSGSLIVSRGRGEDDRRPVALLFAGSETSTIANPIDAVLERFDVAIDGRD